MCLDPGYGNPVVHNTVHNKPFDTFTRPPPTVLQLYRAKAADLNMSHAPTHSTGLSGLSGVGYLAPPPRDKCHADDPWQPGPSSVPAASVVSHATLSLVLTRDGNQCWVCGDTMPLVVAYQLYLFYIQQIYRINIVGLGTRTELARL